MPAYDVTINATFLSTTGIGDISANDPIVAVKYYNMQGIQLREQPEYPEVYIVKETHQSGKVAVKKTGAPNKRRVMGQ